MNGTGADNKSRKKIIIIGAGSIGRRHATNLAALGTDVSVFDVNQEVLKTVCSENNWDPVHDLDFALDQDQYDAAIICTPTNLHIPYAQKAVDAGLKYLRGKTALAYNDGCREPYCNHQPERSDWNGRIQSPF